MVIEVNVDELPLRPGRVWSVENAGSGVAGPGRREFQRRRCSISFVAMLRKTGEGRYANIHALDKPREPEEVKKASEEVAKEALALAKRLAEERDLHLPEIAHDAGNLLVERAYELADAEGVLDIDRAALARAMQDLSDADKPE